MTRCLHAALALADRGLAIFPCAVKVPLVKWRDDATTDPDRVRRMWARWPDANIGLPMGARCGLVALDVDNKRGINGAVVVEALEIDLGTLPPTATQATPSGGTHRIFRCAAAGQIRNSASVIAGCLAPGLDIRGEGGFVVVAPSAGYRWIDTSPAAELPGKWAAVFVSSVREAVKMPAWQPRDDGERDAAARWSIKALQNEALGLAGKWLVEVSELAALGKSEVEVIESPPIAWTVSLCCHLLELTAHELHLELDRAHVVEG